MGLVEHTRGEADCASGSVVHSVPAMSKSQPEAPDQPPTAELGEFVSLLTEHQALLRGYIRVLIPNASDVRDVLQNTNLALWEHREDFESGSNFKAWAFAVARYRALEHHRKMRRNHHLVFDDEVLDLLSQSANDAQDVAHLERKQLALDRCLDELKPEDRALVTSRYSETTTLEEYSRRDGRTPGSLRVALNRLRHTLRLCIESNLAMEEGAS